jgi:hypothetical protein
MKNALVIAALTAIAGVANADFTTVIASSNSNGPAGNAGNTVTPATYGGVSSIYSRYDLTGRLTEVNTGTYANEAIWRIRNTTKGSQFDFQGSTTGNFTGTININAGSSGLFWIDNGDNYTFESYESFDDAGLDATWTNTTHNFSGAVTATSLGNFASGSAFDFDTFTSGFDTELALYTASGIRVADNDDTGGLQSRINAGVLADGQYLIIVGGYDSAWANYAALAGAAAGNFNLNLNGTTVASGALAARSFAVFSFTVPTPGSLALLGLGGLVAARRRR